MVIVGKSILHCGRGEITLPPPILALISSLRTGSTSSCLSSLGFRSTGTRWVEQPRLFLVAEKEVAAAFCDFVQILFTDQIFQMGQIGTISE